MKILPKSHLRLIAIGLISIFSCEAQKYDSSDNRKAENFSEKESHYVEVLDSLYEANQAQLDLGVGMKQAEMKYAHQMDSMLNVIYEELMLQVSQEQKDAIRSDQNEWLIEKNRYYEEIENELKDEFGGTVEVNSDDFQMVIYSRRAEFIRERAEELIGAID